MKTALFQTEALGKPIEAFICDTGHGMNVTIAGGDKGHIGAVSARYEGADPISAEFPTHREGVVAEKWAVELHSHFKCTVAVSCGVHYDGITKDQIYIVLDALDRLLSDVIQSYQNQTQDACI